MAEKILNSVRDAESCAMIYFVSWKKRADGSKPLPSWETHEQMA